MKKEIKIPFAGFYESTHTHMIDEEINQIFMNDQGDIDMPENFMDGVNYQGILQDYSIQYIRIINEAIQESTIRFKLDFKELYSPREYNFTTDEIIAVIDMKYIINMYKLIDTDTFIKLVKDKFTSYDGFHSFYSNDYLEWGDISTWDINQLTTIFECYMIDFVDIDLHSWDTFEDLTCNGILNSIVYENLNYSALEMANMYWEKTYGDKN